MAPHARQGHGSHPLGELWSPAGLVGCAGQLGRASDHQEFHWGQNPTKRDQQYNRLLIYSLNGLVGLRTQKTKGCFDY